MSPKKVAPHFSRNTVLALLQEAGSPLRTKNIYGIFNADAALKKVIKATLARMVDAGEIIQVGKSFGLADTLPRMTGTLDIRRSGVGYIIPEDRRQKDLFVHPSHFGGAWPGDKVVALIDTGRKEAPEGRIVAIVERAASTLLVRVSRKVSDGEHFCHPTDARMPFYTVVDTSAIPEPASGDILSVRPEHEDANGLWRCTALRRLGEERDLATQELLVKTGHSIPELFPEPVLRQADMLPASPLPEDWAERADLRDMDLVTIDGETAKDFDDAVFVQRLDSGGFRLVVAIADVSHYVPEGSPLDIEARARGNSYYFPLSVEPMFPEELSNGLCSLRPDVPRLAMVVDTVYTPDGEPGPSRFLNAVIRSSARLTYTQVQTALDGTPNDAIAPILPMLHDAAALASVFMRRRMDRGCLDFDIPEAQVRLDGTTITVQAGVRLFSHRLIEEFMIAANERVAEFLGARERIFPYRIHPHPEERKLESLLRLLTHTTIADRLPQEADQKGLQQLAQASRGTDMEYLVSRLILRTMMQAQYSPDNDGHYGLASEAYCHFTSPIRRYADLLVHRALKRHLAGQPEGVDSETLTGICDGLNQLERKAMEAEREIQKRAGILALEGRQGETMRGVISGVADFGFWVELIDMPVDGLVRLATLDDYYVYDPERQDLLGQRTGRVFAMGQSLDVVLEALSLERVEITFTLPVVDNQTAAQNPAGPRRTTAKPTSRCKTRQKQRSARPPKQSRR